MTSIRNIVVIVSDTFRTDHLGCYGNPWIHTPNLDRLAAESVLFENAYAEALFTKPARRVMFTGRRALPFADWRIVKGDDIQAPGWQPLGEDVVTLAEWLSDQRRVSALITDCVQLIKPGSNFARGFDEWHWIRGNANDLYRSAPKVVPELWQYTRPELFEAQAEAAAMGKQYTSNLSGFVGRKNRVQEVLLQYLRNVRDRRTEEDYFASRVFREGMRWVEENACRKEPLFLWLDVFDPHEPWDPPPRYADLYSQPVDGFEPIWTVGVSQLLTEEEKARVRGLYAGSVTFVDHWIGEFLHKLEVMHLLDDTVVVFTSDHGTSLGEHIQMHKADFLMYRHIVRIPLLIRHPDKTWAGKRVPGFVQHQDLFPTLLSLCGVGLPGPADGFDIWPLVTGERTSLRDHAITASSTYASVRSLEWSCIFRWAETPKQFPDQLYSMTEDIDEEHDVAESYPEVISAMKHTFESELSVTIPVNHRPLGGGLWKHESASRPL